MFEQCRQFHNVEYIDYSGQRTADISPHFVHFTMEINISVKIHAAKARIINNSCMLFIPFLRRVDDGMILNRKIDCI